IGVTQTALAGVMQFSGFPGRSADFDGNGLVGFSDFLLFVQAFESQIPQFDLDRNGQVGFSDFLIFADVFGK
ncbi:MAG: EF-hand domain-containing protein, partial [Candidatus Latescibacteria bacterium]|nr:EF-hand domain-containing protein [Candidatus Latescibacterota bacterium]